MNKETMLKENEGVIIAPDIQKFTREICPELNDIIGRHQFLQEGLKKMYKYDIENPFKHSLRVAHSANLMCEHGIISDDEKENFLIAALMHDYGKIKLAQSVILKSGKFDARERNYSKKHARESFNYLKERHNKNNLRAAIIAVRHHEAQPNGRNYPRTADREDSDKNITRLSRILGIIDSFDSIISERSYESAQDIEIAKKRLEKDFNTAEDQEIIDILIRENSTARTAEKEH